MEIAQMTKILVGTVSEDMIGDFKTIASNKTQDFFLKFAPRKEDFSGVKIQNNYVVRALDFDGNPKKVSAGQAHALGLSYLTAVRNIMKKNYFMVIDSPFHNISQKTRNGFIDLCIDVSPGTQIILFVTDGEYTGVANVKISGPTIPSVHDHLISNNTLWKEYILDVLCDVCGKETDGHMLKRDGGDHDPVSKTIIREGPKR